MTSPVLTAALCIIGAVGLMALVIAGGMADHSRDTDRDRVDMAAPTVLIPQVRGERRISVWALREREHADAPPHYPRPQAGRSPDDGRTRQRDRAPVRAR